MLYYGTGRNRGTVITLITLIITLQNTGGKTDEGKGRRRRRKKILKRMRTRREKRGWMRGAAGCCYFAAPTTSLQELSEYSLT